MGTHRMGPDIVIVPAHHNTTAAGAPVLGHGRVAHGLECKRGSDE